MARQTILDAFLQHVSHRGNETAALVKEGGRFVPVTWSTMHARAQAMTAALLHHGIRPGDRIALMMATSLDWTLVDLGIVGAQAISVPIYTSNLADEYHFIIEDSGTRLIFTEDEKQTRKFLGGDAQTLGLRKIVQATGSVPAVPTQSDDAPTVLTLEDFLRNVPEDPEAFARAQAAIVADSTYSLIYTSGTTGRPKGVVVSHDNMLYEIEAVAKIDLLRPDDVEFIFLPLAHVFARVLQVAWLGIGHVMAFAQSMDTIKEDIGLSRPTIMAGVPRVYEKFYIAVVKRAHARGGVVSRMFDRAMVLSEKQSEDIARGPAGYLHRAERALYLQLIFKKIGTALMQTLGGRLRTMVSGGAPLAPKIAYFFQDAGLTMLEGYGLTETMGATCVNLPHLNHIGSVGLPLPGTQARLAEDGELLLRGRGISRGYWKNDSASTEAFTDGWFKTGDIATISGRGIIKIVDRKKDLIVTAGGKNVAPQNIENILKTHPIISQSVVHGDRRNYLTALITLDEEALRKFCAEKKLKDGSYADLSQRPEVHAEVARIMEGVNHDLPRYETIKKFKILPADFSVESGEMSPSLKVKRREINKRYAAIFDAFYAESF